MARKKVSARAKLMADHAVILAEHAAKALTAAEQLRIKTRTVKKFWLLETEQAFLTALPALAARIKKKLAKHGPYTVAEVVNMVMAAAESSLQAEPEQQGDLVMVAKKLMFYCLQDSFVMPTLPAKVRKARIESSWRFSSHERRIGVVLASISEEQVSRAVRTILASAPQRVNIADSDHLGQSLLPGLEFFIPEVLRELYPEWDQESLDGIIPIVARQSGEEVELFGLCVIISDQTLTPIHLGLQVSSTSDEVSWLECRLGERGEHGMVRWPYEAVEKRLHSLEGREDKIDWVYKVTYGQRRT
jgi:hypothetical protein